MAIPKLRMVTGAALAVATAASLVACAGGGRPDDEAAVAKNHARNGSRGPSSPTTGSSSPKECTVSAKLVPSCGAWWGISPIADGRQDPNAQVRDFERQIDRPVDIYHGYHTGNELFPTPQEIALTRNQHRMLVLNWKPDVGRTWRQVADGAVDRRIDREAAYLKAHFDKKFWLVIHHEPENEVRTDPGSGKTPSDYRAMFRHVVQRLRDDNVHNALFTVVFMGYSGYTAKPWFSHLYPGDDVVDWIGYDPFATPVVKDYAGLVNKVASAQAKLGLPGFYDYSQWHWPGKPLMISEWAVMSVKGNPDRKADFFRSVSRQFAKYPRIKALIYFNARRANNPAYGSMKMDDTTTSLDAYKSLSAQPEFNVRH